ncbi:NnrS family protein [Marinimicrobium alkaliphilum]|uniref:NnrS family protein n=1 Tax=Marinimicrobium alkaliphilum TaxID=2202654 RepID=UPI000DBA76C6|nr:NnrS family protein [Marinimicrobium alkaliphilum]
MPTANPPVLLAFAFRPFFLLTGAYGAFVVLGWLGYLFGGLPLPLGWSPFKWHSHEMLYGFVPAAIAGFMLTALTNWTGARPLDGGKLLALILLWLAGRVVMWGASWLPAGVVAAVDLAFLPVLGLYVARVILRHGNKRNLVMVAVLALLSLGNLMMHIGFITGKMAWLNAGELLGFNLILLLMAVIAGRITPAFSANWLRARGVDPAVVTRSPLTDRLAVGSLVALLVLDLLPVPAVAVGAVALLAAAVHGVRLIQWAGWRTAAEPLLWILHLAYVWVVLALLLRGLAPFVPGITDSLWQHTAGVGAMGILILGVMTRVAMGHTGRPLKLVRFGSIIYLAIIAAALLRMAAALQWLDYRLGVTLSGVAWILAFSLFVVLYWPVLTQPRADGRPG